MIYQFSNPKDANDFPDLEPKSVQKLHLPFSDWHVYHWDSPGFTLYSVHDQEGKQVGIYSEGFSDHCILWFDHFVAVMGFDTVEHDGRVPWTQTLKEEYVSLLSGNSFGKPWSKDEKFTRKVIAHFRFKTGKVKIDQVRLSMTKGYVVTHREDEVAEAIPSFAQNVEIWSEKSHENTLQSVAFQLIDKLQAINPQLKPL